jgi:hypothetical protein
MYDIDDLIEPQKKGKIRDPFAQQFDQVAKDHRNTWEYQILGQNSGDKSPKQQREYYEKRKGTRAHIEYMSPMEYFDKIDKGFKSRHPTAPASEFEIHKPENFRNPKLIEAAKQGSKFAMPYIEYNEGKFDSQEGRHRASMAYELGVEKMPVVIADTKREYRDSSYDDYQDYVKPKKKKNPFTYDDEKIWEEF